MTILRRIVPPLCAFLLVLYLAGCHGSSNTTPTANAGASAGSTANDANSSTDNASPPRTETGTVTVPEGTGIAVRLLDSLSSARNHGGDTFAATVAEPVFVNGWVAIPRGSDVTGRVLTARPSGHLETPAQLSITLASIQVDGKTHDLRTSDISLRTAAHTKHDAKWIGGLAGGGALLGALVGRGKGAAIGAGVGAGAGTTTAYATGKKDIYLPSEKRLTFIVREPLTVSHVG